MKPGKLYCHWCKPTALHRPGQPVICGECLAKVSPPHQPPLIPAIVMRKRRRRRRAA